MKVQNFVKAAVLALALVSLAFASDALHTNIISPDIVPILSDDWCYQNC